jgi:hypothetical protein
MVIWSSGHLVIWSAIRRAMIFLGIAMLLVACGEVPMVRQQQQAGSLVIFLERPERIAINREVELIVTIIDGQERTISDAIVSLDLVMPEMPMGQNRPLADPLGGGRYRVRTTYSMLGAWKATVVAVVAGQEHRATFDVSVTE